MNPSRPFPRNHPAGSTTKRSAAILGLCLCAVQAFPAEPKILKDPLGLNTETAAWLQKNERIQREAARDYRVDHDFQFSDRRPESGIDFRHSVVEDASKLWVAAHYDHGSGVAVADVDDDGLLDLYFANQLGGNQLWRNIGGGKFEDITEKAGVAVLDGISVAAAFGDLDNDGRPDLMVTNVRQGNLLFKNLGGGKFKNITRESGLGYAGHSSGIVYFDFNRDGLLDVFVSNVGQYTMDVRGVGGYYRATRDAFLAHVNPKRAEQSILYQNMGGLKFKDVSAETGLVDLSWTGDATFCDVNSDGYPDLYVLSMQGDDQLYLNRDGNRFEESTASYFPKTPWGAMGVKFFDFNLDGHLDVYLTDMHSDMTQGQTDAGKTDYSAAFEKIKSDSWCAIEWTDEFLLDSKNNIFGNALYQNNGDGTFTEVSNAKGAETYWPWGFTVADFNADGYEDLFVAGGMGHPFRYGINSLLLNEGGNRFVDSEFLVGVEPRRDGQIEGDWFNLACNGRDRGHPLCDRKNGNWVIYGSLTSRSSAALDFDNDGDLDFVTNEQNGRPMLMVSNRADRKDFDYLKLKLVGKRSNRDGIGAVVKLHVGDQVQTRSHDGKSGYLALSTKPLYFGFKKDAEIKRIEITWPSGTTQTVDSGVAANSVVTVTEPE